MASSVSPLHRARRDVVLHPRSVARITAVHAIEGRKENFGSAHSGEFWDVAKVENLFARSVRRDGRAGGRVVHRTVLRALLLADRAQGSARDGIHDRRSCSSDWRASLRVLLIALGQDWPKENNDGGKSSRGIRLSADLSCDESVLESGECGHVDAARVHPGDFRNDGVRPNRRVSRRGVSCANQIHVAVASISFWKWVVRGISSAYLHVDRWSHWEYLRGTRLSDHCCIVDVRRRIAVPEGESHASNLGRGRRSQAKRSVILARRLILATSLSIALSAPAGSGQQVAPFTNALRDSIVQRIAADSGATV